MQEANSGASQEAIEFHYDMPADFFRLWLGKSMTYTAARFSEPGMAWWLPPFTPCPFSGDGPLDAFIAGLKKGGLPSKRVADVSDGAIFGGVFLGVHMLAMEAGGWTFAGLTSQPWLGLVAPAIVEAAAAAGRQTNETPPGVFGYMGGGVHM